MKLTIFSGVLIFISLIICMTFLTIGYKEKCVLDDFEDWVVMENDIICGDFGVEYFKGMGVVAFHVILFGFIMILDNAKCEKKE